MYRSRSHQVRARQWDGRNTQQLLEFLPRNVIAALGQANTLFSEHRVLISTTAGDWVELRPGWWVIQDISGDSEVIMVHSGNGLERKWRHLKGDVYAAVELHAQAVRWTGNDTAPVTALAGHDNVIADGDRLLVREIGDSRLAWTQLQPGWWAVRPEQPGILYVMSDTAFKNYWEEEDEQS